MIVTKTGEKFSFLPPKNIPVTPKLNVSLLIISAIILLNIVQTLSFSGL